MENAARWMLRTAILFAFLAAPYLMFDLSTAIKATIGGVGLYTLWQIVDLHLKRRGVPVQSAKISLLLVAYGTAVPIIVIGLIVATLLAWPLWAYNPAVLTERLHDSGFVALISVSAGFIVLPLFFLVAAPRLAQVGGSDASRFLAGVRDQGLGRFRRIWLAHTAWGLGFIGALSPTLMAQELRDIELFRDGDGSVSIWDLAATYPSLPLSLVFAAAMLSLARYVEASRDENDAIVRGYCENLPAESHPNRVSARLVSALASCGCTASILLLLYPVHLYFVARGTATGVENLAQAAQAMATLFDRRNSGDWSNAQLAAELNRLGSWTPEAPDAGLATLVADPTEAFADTCTIRIAAGLTDEARNGTGTSAGPDDASTDVKFCVAVSCAPPVAWRAPSALVLLSSHASRARYWHEESYIDVFAEGRAAAPGGYCTETGGLANRFQG